VTSWQEIEDASTLGTLKFSSDTGLYFQREILRPFWIIT